MTSLPAVVFDNGSTTSKAGYAGMTEPEVVVASALGSKSAPRGRSTNSNESKFLHDQNYFVETPDGLLDRPQSSFDFQYMIRKGLVQDWDALETLWHSCIFEKLRCVPEEHNFLVSESPFNSAESREQMAEIMFETFNVAGLSVALQPVLSLIAASGGVRESSQYLSGTVVDCGEGATTIIPVAEGQVLLHAIQQMPIGGRDVTNLVQTCLRKNKRTVSPDQSYEIARQIKEGNGYVCSNLEREQGKNLPEIRVRGLLGSAAPWECSIGEECYLAGEALFQPSLLPGSSSRGVGLSQLVDTTIDSCPIDIKRQLYSNIVLSGGTTMFPEFGRRLQRDVKRNVLSRLHGAHSSSVSLKRESVSSNVQVTVQNQIPQRHSAWLGGSLVASHSGFQGWVKTKEQYEEEGSRIFRYSPGVFHGSTQ